MKQKHQEKHIHRLIKSGPVWKCALPDCKFFVYFKQEYILLGRRVQCNDCGDTFPLDEESMQEDMPRCYFCRNPEAHEVEDTVNTTSNRLQASLPNDGNVRQ